MPQIPRRRAVSAGLVAGAAILLPRFAHAAEFNWKFTSGAPVTHPSTIRFIEAAERVKQQSGGRFEITVYHSGQLGTEMDTLTQVRIGAVQMMVLSNLICATVAPVTSIVSIPFAFTTYDQVWQANDGALGRLCAAEMEKAGYVLTNKILDAGFHLITASTHPIVTVSDLSGFKMRSPPSPLQVSLWRAIGAAPTPMNYAEMYTALQTGVVDGQESSPSLTRFARLYEVQKYCSLTNHMWDGWHVLLSQKSLQKLPRDMADLVMASYDQAGLDARRDLFTLNEECKTFMRDKGVIFNTPPDMAPFRAKLKNEGFYAEWKQKMGDTAWKLMEDIAGPMS